MRRPLPSDLGRRHHCGRWGTVAAVAQPARRLARRGRPGRLRGPLAALARAGDRCGAHRAPAPRRRRARRVPGCEPALPRDRGHRRALRRSSVRVRAARDDRRTDARPHCRSRSARSAFRARTKRLRSRGTGHRFNRETSKRHRRDRIAPGLRPGIPFGTLRRRSRRRSMRRSPNEHRTLHPMVSRPKRLHPSARTAAPSPSPRPCIRSSPRHCRCCSRTRRGVATS